MRVMVKNNSGVPREKRKAIRKFLYYFPGGFKGRKYIDWERDYKWNAHLAWMEKLNKKELTNLMADKQFLEIAKRAAGIESKTNLLFSFEKMALRDAVKTPQSAQQFAEALFNYIYGTGGMQRNFESYAQTLGQLPVKQTRVLTWPLQTVFGFIADPARHIFLKPTVTKRAAGKYNFDFQYESRPNWSTYQSLLDFAALIKEDTKQLQPRDMIDIQSFIWVLGSEEYPD